MDEPAAVSIAAVPSLVESAVHVVGVEAGLAIPTGPRSEVPVVNVQDNDIAAISSQSQFNTQILPVNTKVQCRDCRV